MNAETAQGKYAGWGQRLIENIFLQSRYLLVPLLLMLMYTIIPLTIDTFKALVGWIPFEALAEPAMRTLEVMDIGMIGNLVWLICAGSYYVFVDDKYPDTSGRKRPRCLIHVSSGLLKEKMAGSLIGVSSIHLLKTYLHLFTEVGPVDWRRIMIMLAIYFAFVIGLLAFNHANAADHHKHDDEKKKEEKPNEEQS